MPLQNAFMILLLGAIWSISYLFIKVGVAEITPLTFVAIRTGIAAIILVLALRARGRKFPTLRQWIPLSFMGFFGTLVPYALITWGEVYISSGMAAILNATMPLFTLFLAHFYSEGERMDRYKVLGISVGFLGVVLLLSPDLAEGIANNLLGDLAVVGASLSYAVAAVFARRSLRGQEPLFLSVGQFVTAVAMSAPLAFLVEKPMALSPSPLAWGSLAILGIVNTALAYLIYYWILEHGGAVQASLTTYVIPVGAVFWGWLLLSETIHWISVVGLVVVFLGILAANRFQIVRTVRK